MPPLSDLGAGRLAREGSGRRGTIRRAARVHGVGVVETLASGRACSALDQSPLRDGDGRGDGLLRVVGEATAAEGTPEDVEEGQFMSAVGQGTPNAVEEDEVLVAVARTVRTAASISRATTCR